MPEGFDSAKVVKTQLEKSSTAAVDEIFSQLSSDAWSKSTTEQQNAFKSEISPFLPQMSLAFLDKMTLSGETYFDKIDTNPDSKLEQKELEDFFNTSTNSAEKLFAKFLIDHFRELDGADGHADGKIDINGLKTQNLEFYNAADGSRTKFHADGTFETTFANGVVLKGLENEQAASGATPATPTEVTVPGEPPVTIKRVGENIWEVTMNGKSTTVQGELKLTSDGAVITNADHSSVTYEPNGKQFYRNEKNLLVRVATGDTELSRYQYDGDGKVTDVWQREKHYCLSWGLGANGKYYADGYLEEANAITVDQSNGDVTFDFTSAPRTTFHIDGRVTEQHGAMLVTYANKEIVSVIIPPDSEPWERVPDGDNNQANNVYRHRHHDGDVMSLIMKDGQVAVYSFALLMEDSTPPKMRTFDRDANGNLTKLTESDGSFFEKTDSGWKYHTTSGDVVDAAISPADGSGGAFTFDTTVNGAHETFKYDINGNKQEIVFIGNTTKIFDNGSLTRLETNINGVTTRYTPNIDGTWKVEAGTTADNVFTATSTSNARCGFDTNGDFFVLSDRDNNLSTFDPGETYLKIGKDGTVGTVDISQLNVPIEITDVQGVKNQIQVRDGVITHIDQVLPNSTMKISIDFVDGKISQVTLPDGTTLIPETQTNGTVKWRHYVNNRPAEYLANGVVPTVTGSGDLNLGSGSVWQKSGDTYVWEMRTANGLEIHKLDNSYSTYDGYHRVEYDQIGMKKQESFVNTHNSEDNLVVNFSEGQITSVQLPGGGYCSSEGGKWYYQKDEVVIELSGPPVLNDGRVTMNYKDPEHGHLGMVVGALNFEQYLLPGGVTEQHNGDLIITRYPDGLYVVSNDATRTQFDSITFPGNGGSYERISDVSPPTWRYRKDGVDVYVTGSIAVSQDGKTITITKDGSSEVINLNNSGGIDSIVSTKGSLTTSVHFTDGVPDSAVMPDGSRLVKVTQGSVTTWHLQRNGSDIALPADTTVGIDPTTGGITFKRGDSPSGTPLFGANGDWTVPTMAGTELHHPIGNWETFTATGIEFHTETGTTTMDYAAIKAALSNGTAPSDLFNQLKDGQGNVTVASLREKIASGNLPEPNLAIARFMLLHFNEFSHGEDQITFESIASSQLTTKENGVATVTDTATGALKTITLPGMEGTWTRLPDSEGHENWQFRGADGRVVPVQAHVTVDEHGNVTVDRGTDRATYSYDRQSGKIQSVSITDASGTTAVAYNNGQIATITLPGGQTMALGNNDHWTVRIGGTSVDVLGRLQVVDGKLVIAYGDTATPVVDAQGNLQFRTNDGVLRLNKDGTLSTTDGAAVRAILAADSTWLSTKNIADATTGEITKASLQAALDRHNLTPEQQAAVLYLLQNFDYQRPFYDKNSNALLVVTDSGVAFYRSGTQLDSSITAADLVLMLNPNAANSAWNVLANSNGNINKDELYRKLLDPSLTPPLTAEQRACALFLYQHWNQISHAQSEDILDISSNMIKADLIRYAVEHGINLPADSTAADQPVVPSQPGTPAQVTTLADKPAPTINPEYQYADWLNHHQLLMREFMTVNPQTGKRTGEINQSLVNDRITALNAKSPRSSQEQQELDALIVLNVYLTGAGHVQTAEAFFKSTMVPNENPRIGEYGAVILGPSETVGEIAREYLIRKWCHENGKTNEEATALLAAEKAGTPLSPELRNYLNANLRQEIELIFKLNHIEGSNIAVGQMLVLDPRLAPLDNTAVYLTPQSIDLTSYRAVNDVGTQAAHYRKNSGEEVYVLADGITLTKGIVGAWCAYDDKGNLIGTLKDNSVDPSAIAAGTFTLEVNSTSTPVVTNIAFSQQGTTVTFADNSKEVIYSNHTHVHYNSHNVVDKAEFPNGIVETAMVDAAGNIVGYNVKFPDGTETTVTQPLMPNADGTIVISSGNKTFTSTASGTEFESDATGVTKIATDTGLLLAKDSTGWKASIDGVDSTLPVVAVTSPDATGAFTMTVEAQVGQGATLHTERVQVTIAADGSMSFNVQPPNTMTVTDVAKVSLAMQGKNLTDPNLLARERDRLIRLNKNQLRGQQLSGTIALKPPRLIAEEGAIGKAA